MRGPDAVGDSIPPPRDLAERKRDVLELWRSQNTAWVATSGADGPHLVPLLFHHDGTTFTFATFANSRTVSNVAATPRARAAIGHPYDLAMIDGPISIIEPDAIDLTTAEEFAALLRGGPDPRRTPGFVYLQLTPTRVQAWRSFAELGGRELMRSGRWLV